MTTLRRADEADPNAFDHRDPGTSPEDWGPLLHSLPTRDLPPAGTQVVVIAAHPDDETLGCGALMACASASGHVVTVIVATDGEASHPDSPTHTPDMLARLRRHEAPVAVRILAPTARLIQLGLPDGGLPESGEALRSAIEEAVGADPAWLLATWGGDRHPDHEACSHAARAVAAARPGCVVLEYPIWAWHWGDPRGTDLPVEHMARIGASTAGGDRRMRALDVYRSQVLPLSAQPGDEAILGPSVISYFDRDYDVLIDPSEGATQTAARSGAAAHAEYFENLYAQSDDPWGIGSRWYEQRKRALVLDSLPRRHFARGFEPGCAAGHLTLELSKRCTELVAADADPRAVALTRQATAAVPAVSVHQLRIPEHWPEGRFDLIVISEMGYYIDNLEELARRTVASLTGDGVVLLCHWRHPAAEHLHSAEKVHHALREGSGLHLLATHREDDFLLDVLAVDGRTVAQTDGIVR